MESDSTFFSKPEDCQVAASTPPELISSSKNGWSELYRVEKNGRIRVYKALKAKFRGQKFYEMLLEKEYQIGRSLSHVAICEVSGYLDTQLLGHVIEMEWIDGMALDKWLKQNKPGKRQAQHIALQICDALSYIHARQTIHKDIKPSNILVTNSGNIKIIDFGVADTNSHTILKLAAGTQMYAAPEILRGESGSPQSDIYSLGHILKLLLPSKTKIIQKCTQQEARKRYQNADGVKEQILSSNHYSWALAAVLMILLLASSLTILSTQTADADAHPSQMQFQENPDTTAVDIVPEDIDELFRQATEMIISKED